MNKTVIYQIIDGHKIITGFDRPTIDPVETNKIVSTAIKETSEYQALEAKKAEYGKAEIDRLEAARSVRRRVNEKLKANKNLTRDNVLETMDITKENYDYSVAIQTLKETQRDIPSLAADLDAKIIALRREHAVYFEPRAGEVIKGASEVETLLRLIKGRSEGSLITLEGETIEDNREKVYFLKSNGKWSRTRIAKLGDKIPGNAVIEPDETQEKEIERDRISVLPSDIKAAEKAVAMDSALLSASAMRNELEIKKDSSALKKSQDLYSAEVERIEALYG